MIEPATLGFVFAIVGLIATAVLSGVMLFRITNLDGIKRSLVQTDAAASDGPLEQLRERYARGELSDEEFERKVQRLVETENVSREDLFQTDNTSNDSQRDDSS